MEKIEKAIHTAQLIRNYYKGTLTESERLLLSAWLAERPDHVILFRKLYRELHADAATGNIFEPRVEAALKTIKKKLKIPNDRKFAYKKPWRIAAVIALLIGSYLIFQQVLSNDTSKEVFTAVAENKHVLLDDGTKVWLGPASKLTYSRAFNKANREVTLEGSAYFDVAQQASHPFVVYSNDIRTNVLGTSFKIKAYTEDDASTLIVTSGKVKVTLGQEETDESISTLLQRGEKIIYQKKERQLKKINYPLHSNVLAKISQGVYVYDGEKVQDIIKDLERAYHVRIVCNDRIKERLFYGDLHITKDISTFLDKLTFTTNSQWEKSSEHQYHIKFNQTE